MDTGFGFIMGGVIALGLLAGGCYAHKPSGAHSVSGTIETDEVRVAPRYGGRVEKILVAEGDALKGGQVIAELDAAELRARRDQAAAQLAELEAGPEELFSQKTISQTEREQAVTRSRALEKNAAAARSRYDLLLAGTRAERLAQARAQLAEIESQLREMKIVAPSDCVLEVLSVKVGDVLAPNGVVATLLLPQHIWVRVYVPETWLGHIKLGDLVKARVDSDPGQDFAGVVEQIAREAEFTPRNVQTVGERIKQVFGIKVRLDNRQGKLRAGMAADVIFQNVPK